LRSKALRSVYIRFVLRTSINRGGKAVVVCLYFVFLFVLDGDQNDGRATKQEPAGEAGSYLIYDRNMLW